MQSNRPLPKGFELEGHHILSVIAAGGLSFVYLAYDRQRSLVALKEYMPAALELRTGSGVSPTVKERDAAMFRDGMRCFFEEANALAGLRHPNVVRVVDFFRANGTAYMAMRYESGRTLQQQLLAGDAAPNEDWLRLLFVRLLNGLREVHAARLLHLDIKPANIWIRDDETPVLIDFGAARRALSEQGANLLPIYTPGFAAPEMHQSRDRLGPWSDIYSVGATLHACIAEGTRSSYSAALLQTINACLRTEPAERPRSVLELQRALAAPVTPARAA